MRIEAVLPKTKLLKFDLNRALRGAVDSARKPIEADLKAVTGTWKTKVRFRTRFNNEGGNLVVSIVTRNKIFIYVDQGTRPHIIQAKNAPYLSFRTGGFIPKTYPGKLLSGSGQKATGGFVKTQSVNHPGTEPRYFSANIAQKHKKTLVAALKAAIRKATGGR